MRSYRYYARERFQHAVRPLLAAPCAVLCRMERERLARVAVYVPQAVAAELRAAANGEARSTSNYLAHHLLGN